MGSAPGACPQLVGQSVKGRPRSCGRRGLRVPSRGLEGSPASGRPRRPGQGTGVRPPCTRARLARPSRRPEVGAARPRSGDAEAQTRGPRPRPPVSRGPPVPPALLQSARHPAEREAPPAAPTHVPVWGHPGPAWRGRVGRQPSRWGHAHARAWRRPRAPHPFAEGLTRPSALGSRSRPWGQALSLY